MNGRRDFDVDGIRQSLVQERDTLREMSATAADDRRPVELDQQSVGRLSRMDALQVQAMAKAVGTRRQERMQRIEAALRRLEDGEYGYCAVCDEEIPAGRLAIDPVSERCVNCAN